MVHPDRTLVFYLGVSSMSEQQPPERSFDQLLKGFHTQLAELSAVIKRAAKGDPEARQRVPQLLEELNSHGEQVDAEAERMKQALGISDELLDALEDSDLPVLDQSGRHAAVMAAEPTSFYDDDLPSAVERFSSLVPPDWLRSEAAYLRRNDEGSFCHPFQMVNGIRIAPLPKGVERQPQRFARALLLAQEFLSGRDTLDAYESALLVPELVQLGRSMEQIEALGPVASRKLRTLWQKSDREVESAAYELLVGAGFVRRGSQVEMLDERAQKEVRGFARTPDFRWHEKGLPRVVECKRRSRLTQYEQQEAELVMALYSPASQALKESSIYAALDADFSVELKDVPVEAFVRAAVDTARASSTGERCTREYSWGGLSSRPLNYYNELKPTLIYSPDFLAQVFGWSIEAGEWDGLICEIESPWRSRIDRAREPICLKWRSNCQAALQKKTRGLTSFLGDAMKQLPAGEIAFIYINFEEGARAELADRRLQRITQEFHEWTHEFGPLAGVIVLQRIFPRPVGIGKPDLTENVTVLLARDLDRTILRGAPMLAFVSDEHMFPHSIRRPTPNKSSSTRP